MNEEQLVFDLVPLTRAWREVMQFNAQSRLLRHAAQFELAQPHSMPIAAPAAGGVQAALKFAVVLACEMMTGNWEAGYFAYDCKRHVAGAQFFDLPAPNQSLPTVFVVPPIVKLRGAPLLGVRVHRRVRPVLA